jgi:hypothetical protein
MIELKRKPVGRDFIGGRELMIIDEAGNPRFTHRIKLPRSQPCYPFTWHRKLTSHDPLEVTFKGPAPDQHSIVFKTQAYGSGTPRYVFSTQSDYIGFQSQIRGKDLVCPPFNFRQIRAGTSTKHGEATDQHLKIWRDRVNQDYSISFYASAVEKPRHLEFPISMFCQELKSGAGASEVVELNFTMAAASKRKFSRAFSRSPTERSSGSVSTAGPSIFSRAQTGFSTAPTITTIADSGVSIASFGSDDSREGRKNSLSPIETLARQLKYLRIEFSDADEAARFRNEFQNYYKEETSRPLDFYHGLENWQLEASHHTQNAVTGESSLNEIDGTSPSMSPVFEMDGRQNLVELDSTREAAELHE